MGAAAAMGSRAIDELPVMLCAVPVFRYGVKPDHAGHLELALESPLNSVPEAVARTPPRLSPD